MFFTIIQTNALNRFDISMDVDDKDQRIIEGYIERGDDDLWRPFRLDGIPVTSVGDANPVVVAPLVIENFDARSGVKLDRLIEEATARIAELKDTRPDSPLIPVRERMLASLTTSRAALP